MADAKHLSSLREVRGAALADVTGELVDSRFGDIGDDLVAAMAFATHQLGQAAASLGLGELQMVSVKACKVASVTALDQEQLLVVTVDPGKPITAVEKHLEQRPFSLSTDPLVAAPPRAIGVTDAGAAVVIVEASSSAPPLDPSEFWLDDDEAFGAPPATQRRLPPPPPSARLARKPNEAVALAHTAVPTGTPLRERTDTVPWLDEPPSSELRRAIDEAFIELTDC